MSQEYAPTSTPRLTVEPLASHHDRAAFSCGVPELDNYILRFAAQQDKRDISRTLVAVPAKGSDEIMGYYTLSNYGLEFASLPQNLSKKLPSSIVLPATLLGRLAIDERHQSQGLGKKLLLHALREALRATHQSASLGVVVDAMTDDLVGFYQKRGFVAMPDKPRHLIVPISTLRVMFPGDAKGLPNTDEILDQAAEAAALMEELSTVLQTMSPAALGDHTLQRVSDLRHRLEALKATVPDNVSTPDTPNID